MGSVRRLGGGWIRPWQRGWYELRITSLSLVYNEFISPDYVLDTCLAPWFWLGDHVSQAMGPLLAATVVGLNVSVVLVAYLVGLPYYWAKNPPLALALLVGGQWFFVNLVFHFWRAWRLSPGSPPSQTRLNRVASICQKCIAPKPPRTHHCSVCHRCHLLMDHHCPWLDNCVGFRNHRHFFLYMVFTVWGCLFLMVFGFEIAYYQLWSSEPPPVPIRSAWTVPGVSTRSLVILVTCLTSGCFVLLGGLCLWHARLISRGETSIEAHLNRSETKRLARLQRTYRNPYDFTPYYNWCLFLGVIEGRGWWRHVFWPSSHPPYGNGLEFDTFQACSIPWNHPPPIVRTPSQLA